MERARQAQRPSRHQRGYGAEHVARRATVLTRDPECKCTGCTECGAYGCYRLSEHADHVMPKYRGGTDDLDNYQGMCRPCHKVKSAAEASEWLEQRRGGAVLVCGPPAAGKTTFVNERRQPGDLVYDLDEIVKDRLGVEPYRYKAQDATPLGRRALRRLTGEWRAAKRNGEPVRLWVIVSGWSRHQRERYETQLGARVVVLAVPLEECTRRIVADPQRRPSAQQVEIARRWWERYQRVAADEFGGEGRVESSRAVRGATGRPLLCAKEGFALGGGGVNVTAKVGTYR